MPYNVSTLLLIRTNFIVVAAGERYAFIYDSVILDYISRNEPCNTRTLGDIFLKTGYAVGFAKTFPDVDKFDLAILRLRESGKIEELERKWLGGTCPDPSEGIV